MINIQNIGYRIGKKDILQKITTAFQPGQFNIILGPNGSGKSSLLKIIAGYNNDFTGAVLYNGINVKDIQKNELAKFRAVMSQQPELSFPLAADEVVMMGRYPHFVFNPGKKDIEICREIMERMNLLPLAERNYLSLSGGEKQRVQFARVLAQIWEAGKKQSRYLFLDEPIASLDIRYQHEFLQMAKTLATPDTTVIAVLHDINLAIQYGDKLVFMKNGEIIRQGAPVEVVTAGIFDEVFDIKVTLINPPGSKPMIICGPQ